MKCLYLVYIIKIDSGKYKFFDLYKPINKLLEDGCIVDLLRHNNVVYYTNYKLFVLTKDYEHYYFIIIDLNKNTILYKLKITKFNSFNQIKNGLYIPHGFNSKYIYMHIISDGQKHEETDLLVDLLCEKVVILYHGELLPRKIIDLYTNKLIYTKNKSMIIQSL